MGDHFLTHDRPQPGHDASSQEGLGQQTPGGDHADQRAHEIQEYPSITLAWDIVAALTASGVRDIVYCPGSRCAPFAYVLYAAQRANTVRTHVRLDERSAAFLALGLSRGSDDEFGLAPVAIVTTSGTAVAELHAGVVEAYHSHIPLIIVSADRPNLLHGVGASQTTTQRGIFGPHVVSERELHSTEAGCDAVGARVERLVAQARGLPRGVPGPVHLNVCLDTPLVPADLHALRVRADLSPSTPPAARVRVLASPIRPTAWDEVVEPDLRTVILAGDGASPQAREWAQMAQIPIFAEPTSGLVGTAHHIPFQQSLLSDPDVASCIQQVIVTGRPTLSRPVSALLARADVRVVVVGESGQWPDVSGTASCVVAALSPREHSGDEDEADVPRMNVCDDVSTTPDDGHTQWLAELRARAQTTQTRIDEILGRGEPQVPTLMRLARLVWESTQGPLILGASNTIRAVDLVARCRREGIVVANRGAAGIDGTLATASGVALAQAKATTVLVGDLTFLHDASALAQGEHELTPALDIIVADDRGGGIFATLEHGKAEYSDVCRRWFATPQSVDLSSLARAYGVEYHRGTCLDDCAAFLSTRTEAAGMRILHVPIRTGVDDYVDLRAASRPQR
ncbi:2-succinyl-5-enolpyruvyl-6-hydroxy-3-cyclohexene-1-carboxylic-acid synthase [Schaalia sp. ZJ405]|uniref:2-succinyl-5-enolpyruvyl-6-hydroxy-3- cyclohexene-1-carboxylic-acid synthase n=1 Tax=Schaalia sp. ZJ405 TaxID=2709403 RepID=UPI0013ED9BD1|nr:2-succinyl-5-enolpyruvyl-6-hydroxy-3-cyclohexene-1-carboxylic-acid synthase [Schaalia sp. ZJ405]QPK81573.1 2-succinyl-5-enolpyruvyl-6-hydroxy-3-cyclohexene-1-carboxylic-acid synthase [Schaalia sp. ZJ405]